MFEKIIRCLCLAIVLGGCTPIAFAAGPFRAIGHKALVAQSGIRPHQIGTHEGVGMSTRGYAAAVQNACYWGQRQPVSIQYSRQGNRYYAVVRYR